MAKAIVPLANGFEEIEALGVVDILRRGGVTVVTASIHGTTDVLGAHGVTVKADALFGDVADGEYDAVVLPGGGEGMENLRASEAVIGRLRRQKDEGRLLCAICAAPLVLVAAGVLDEDQHVTCYPTCQMDLDRPWVDQSVVEHDGVITAQGPGTTFLFGFVILKALVGEQMAQRVMRSMVANIF